MKIIVTQLGRIGDMILLTPVFSALKENFKNVEITVIASKHNHFVLKNNPNIDKILIYNKKIIDTLKIFKFFAVNKFDYHVNPKDHSSSESRMFARLIRAKTKIGFNKVGTKGPFDISISDRGFYFHYTERMFFAFEKMGLPKPDKVPRPVLFESFESKSYVEDFLKDIDNFYLINISASQPTKLWQKEKWVDFINKTKGRHPFVLTYAPSEKDIADFILAHTEGVLEFKSRSINDVISLVKRTNALITIDTALVHISAAWDIFLIGMFSGIDKEYYKFEPLNTKFIALRNTKDKMGVGDIEVTQLIEQFNMFMK